jgi:hypothetical protein
MPHALPRTPGYHSYLIRLEHGYGCETEEIRLEAVGPEVALNHLSAIPNKRRAIMFEDGKKIADLTFLEGYWQVAN